METQETFIDIISIIVVSLMIIFSIISVVSNDRLQKEKHQSPSEQNRLKKQEEEIKELVFPLTLIRADSEGLSCINNVLIVKDSSGKIGDFHLERNFMSNYPEFHKLWRLSVQEVGVCTRIEYLKEPGSILG